MARCPSIARLGSHRKRAHRKLAIESLEPRHLLAADPELMFGPTFREVLQGEPKFVGSTAFFSDFDQEHGIELWKTDAPGAGAQLVADINAEGNSYPDHFKAVGSRLFFTARDQLHGREIWSSDGTEEGTRMLFDFAPGPSDGIVDFIDGVNDTLVFAGRVSNNDCAIWGANVSSPTPILLANTCWISSPSPGQREHIQFKNKLIFSGTDDQNVAALWETDGTAAGTRIVRDLYPGYSHSSPRELTRVGEFVYFYANDETGGSALWRTDASESGTVKVRDLQGVTTRENSLIAVKDRAFFVASDGEHGFELWTSDGTSQGTKRISDIRSGTDSSDIRQMVAFADQLFFSVDDGVHGVELWRSDGTAVGTKLFLDIRPGSESAGPARFTVVGSTLFFSATDEAHGNELWKTDGTPNGTTLVYDLREGPVGSGPSLLTSVGDQLFFVANDGIHGGELWQTDGNVSLPPRLHEVRTGAFGAFTPLSFGEFAGSLIPHDHELLFIANDAAGVQAIWRITPLSEDAVRVTNSGGRARKGHEVNDLFVVGSTQYLFVQDYSTLRTALYRTDGTVEGTFHLKDVSAVPRRTKFPTALGDKLFFAVEDESTGFLEHLWTSDGTSAGTRHVFQTPQWGEIIGLGATDHEIYFVTAKKPRSLADPKETLVQLWKIANDDLTAERIHEYQTSACSICIVDTSFVVLGSTVYFVGYGPEEHYRDLWTTDGTTAGTRPVTEIGVSAPNSALQILGILNDKLLLQVDDRKTGVSLWITDGESRGTEFLHFFSRANLSFGLQPVGNVGSRFVFFASDKVSGTDPWVTDGTPAGTRILQDVGEGPDRMSLRPLGIAGVALLFSHSKTIWRTDGTSEGTLRVAEIPTRAFAPIDSVTMGPEVFFMYSPLIREDDDQVNLWKSDGTPAGTQLVTVIEPDDRVDSFIQPGIFAGKDALWFVDNDRTALWKRPQIVYEVSITAGGTILVQKRNSNLEIVVDGTVLFNEPLAEFTAIRIYGSDQTESFVIDFSQGDPVPRDGLTIFTEAEEVDTDSLRLLGATVDSVTYSLNEERGGVLQVGDSQLTFHGLARLIDDLPASKREFRGMLDDSLLTLQDDLVPGNGISRLNVESQWTIDFVNPSVNVTIDAGSGRAAIQTPDIQLSGQIEVLVNLDADRTDRLRVLEEWRPLQRLTVANRLFIEVAWKEAVLRLPVLGSAWRNPIAHLDVNGDGAIAPLDFLSIVNELNSPTIHDLVTRQLDLPNAQNAHRAFYDVDGNGFLSPLDGLTIVNFLNGGAQAEAWSEASLGAARSEPDSNDRLNFSVANHGVLVRQLKNDPPLSAPGRRRSKAHDSLQRIPPTAQSEARHEDARQEIVTKRAGDLEQASAATDVDALDWDKLLDEMNTLTH